jgi:hypothetical protein
MKTGSFPLVLSKFLLPSATLNATHSIQTAIVCQPHTRLSTKLHNMHLITLVLFFAEVMFSSLVASQAIPGGCTNITIPVTVTASCLSLPTTLNTANFLTVLEPIIAAPLNTVVSGTFNISATYCEPVQANATLYNTLQLLVHGFVISRPCRKYDEALTSLIRATYTKAYWFGEYYHQNYSWVSFTFL